ncbi:MAG: HD domain-containing protein, partial [Nitrospinales bacterium]
MEKTANSIIKKTVQHVRDLHSGDGSGHDWWHIYRVWTVAKKLAEAEGADLTIVELAALLHDIADWKFYDGDETQGIRVAREWLKKIGVDSSTIMEVCTIISEISYKGAGVPTPMSSLEGMVVQDADRLDAMGAIGTARAFAYGGYKGRLIYHPDQPPVSHQSFEAYKNNTGPSINHFYEKLLLLKDRMNTECAKKQFFIKVVD